MPMRCAARPRGSAARSSRRRCSTDSGSRRTDTGVSRSSARCRCSCRICPTTTSSRRRRKPGVRRLFALPHLGAAPVAGTAGLVAVVLAPGHRAMGWHADPEPVQKAAGRRCARSTIRPGLAVRVVGEAATRTEAPRKPRWRPIFATRNSRSPRSRARADLRPWNEQLRQPIFLATPSSWSRSRRRRAFCTSLRARHARRRPAGDQVRAEMTAALQATRTGEQCACAF